MVTIHGRLQRTWRRVHAAHLRSTLLLTETTKGFGVSVNAVRDDIMGQVLDVELTKKKSFKSRKSLLLINYNLTFLKHKRWSVLRNLPLFSPNTRAI